MTTTQLAEILKDMYENAVLDKTAMIHLFAIKYADAIKENKITPKEILSVANMPASYFAEINKGIKLAKYVDIKDAYK